MLSAWRGALGDVLEKVVMAKRRRGACGNTVAQRAIKCTRDRKQGCVDVLKRGREDLACLF